MLVKSLILFGMRKGEELKTPRHASAAALRDDRLPHSQHLLLSSLLANSSVTYLSLRYRRAFISSNIALSVISITLDLLAKVYYKI